MKVLPIIVSVAFPIVGAFSVEVRVESVPERGVQPQVAVDARGTAHLVYLRGDPRGCDVRYVRRAKGARQWSAPVSVNSERSSAVAMGTIRGAQLSFGKGGTLHVVWNGAAQSGQQGMALFYSRLEPGQAKFEPQRNLLGDTSALDGGASVAANERGEVFLLWHGKRDGDAGDETARVVFVLKSTDNGATFSAPAVANADFAGTCACCSLKALAAPNGELFTLYRAARSTSQRDMTLLASTDGGTTFRHETLHPWSTNQCPMSSAALLASAQGVRAAWETDGKIFSRFLTAGQVAPEEIVAGKAKHPTMAVNARGETLIAWVIGTGWNRGGELAWTILDPAGKTTAQRGKADGVPVWSHVAAYAEPAGDFVILR
jgi:hypothetical protein